MVKTVVVLGGSYAGLHITHYLLKNNASDVKVILVSKVRSQETTRRISRLVEAFQQGF